MSPTHPLLTPTQLPYRLCPWTALHLSANSAVSYQCKLEWITRLPSFRALIFKLDIIDRTTNGFMKTRWDHAVKIFSTVMAHQNGSVMLAIILVSKAFLPKWTVWVCTLWYPWLNLCPDEKFQARQLWESETQYGILSLKSRGQADPNNQAGGKVSIFQVHSEDILTSLFF